MRWKKILLVMFIVTANCVQLMPTHAQIFGLDLDLDPFGLRRRKAQQASRADTSDEDYDPEEDEPHAPSIIPRIPLPDLNADPLGILRDRGRSDHGRGKGKGRGRGRGKGRGRGPGHGSNSKAESDEEDIPRSEEANSRSHPGRGRGPPNKNVAGPCGQDNRLCHGANFVKELKLNWSSRVHNGTGIFLRDPNSPGSKRFVPIGIEQPNDKYDRCETPAKEKGYCRHLEHCVLDEFRNNFIKFLEYRCDIPLQNFVGVCCPEKENEPRGPNNSGFRPRSTNRPRTEPSVPNRPSNTNRECGVNNIPMARIVGGRLADPRAWPWMAALLKKTEAVDHRNGQYCGGVLISEFHVLTAAHCVDGFEVQNLAVRIGEYDFSMNNRTASSPQDIDVATYFTHEEYNRYSYKNDIAILKLSKSAYFDDRIKSVCLPSPDLPEQSLANEKAIITGFGTIYYGGPTSDKLMEITVPIWKQEDCKAAYTQPIEDTNLCAGVYAGSKDSCQGDSGGPLQLMLRGRWTTVGIVSWGIRCAEPGYPGVYSRISKYVPWIFKQIKRS